ncbi:hypothetical protein GGR28_002702 [Lewinella aquimaris]|uniref:Uncharacterized protein n=1 Tax=Neolewinella aquimaris TaxID=1835722 RepID=A0A840E8N4_9BACT|nr:DUF6702 family protein [Neolewinella aquimaris]MBB4080072.1 hypothetical protein [Neolewinella aquimaris]
MNLPLILLLLFAPPAHDYHVSKTNVRYVSAKSEVQVEMHVFVDDLEEAMQDAGAPVLDLGTADEHIDSERYVTAYLEKHFKIEWNGELLPVALVGWELEDDMHGLWIYLVAEASDPPQNVTVQNSVLTEFYADQKNIVKLFNGKDRLTTLLMDRDRLTGRLN